MAPAFNFYIVLTALFVFVLVATSSFVKLITVTFAEGAYYTTAYILVTFTYCTFVLERS